ncbi:MAG: hypothetical protein J6U10_03850, partial [Lachnospiraceae bacterium]|nr:hypothetical protein [Lachnospiraceae bacterium]
VSYTEERELPEVALCLATSETFGGGLILPKSAYTCTWVSDTPEIVSVAGGKYRGVGAGQGNIAAQFSYNNMSYTENYDVRVASIDIDDYCSVETIPDQPYTGGAVTPDVTVTFNGSVLEKDKDYTLSYQNNVGPGSAYAVITGQGNFRGSTWQYFYIPAPTSTPTPTKAPTSTPTPTKAPTSTPTPTQAPTQAPTKAPTSTPTPTKAPTSTPTPTQAPTQAPTSTPTPTQAPTKAPTDTPTPTPTRAPTNTPTPTPTQAPTQAPTDTPTDTPAPTPTKTPQATQPPAESAQKPGKPDDESEVPAGVWIIIGLGAAISIGGTAGILLFRKK